jgi:ATP-dependent Clp protease ATP-binding subunit ClpA
MFDIEIFTDKIAESGRILIRGAYDEAKSRGHNQLKPEHVLMAFINTERPFFNQLMQSLNLDPQVVLESLQTSLSQSGYGGRSIRMDNSLSLLFSNALKHAHKQNRRYFEASDMMRAIFMDKQSTCVKLFEQLGATPEVVIEKLQGQIRLKDTDPQPPHNQRGHQ